MSDIQKFIDACGDYHRRDIEKDGPVGHPFPHYRHLGAIAFAADEQRKLLDASFLRG